MEHGCLEFWEKGGKYAWINVTFGYYFPQVG